MVSKATGVIITTIKLKIQFPLVARALVGARILRGTISAGYLQMKSAFWSITRVRGDIIYSQVIPNHPIAKNVLNTKRKTACAIPAWALMLFGSLVT
jgi:hypothetical protein